MLGGELSDNVFRNVRANGIDSNTKCVVFFATFHYSYRGFPYTGGYIAVHLNNRKEPSD